MSIIDETYFTKHPTKLPQSEALGNGVAVDIQTGDVAMIDDNIEIYEPQFLTYLLGKDLADEFIAGLAVTPTPATKWTALKNKLVNSTTKRSPIANYVYCFILEEQSEYDARVGTVANKTENATQISCTHKQTKAWNLMVEELIVFIDWLILNRTTYEHDEVYIETDYHLLTYLNRFAV
jgi:hypothetical protein